MQQPQQQVHQHATTDCMNPEAGQHPTVVQSIPAEMHVNPDRKPEAAMPYPSQLSKYIGVGLVAGGIVAFLLNIWMLILRTSLSEVCHGLWTGTMMVITGAFGIMAANRRTQFEMKLFLILSMITTVLSTCLLSVGVVGAVADYEPHYQDESLGLKIFMQCVLVVIGSASALACFTATLISYKGVYGNSEPAYQQLTNKIVIIGTDNGQPAAKSAQERSMPTARVDCKPTVLQPTAAPQSYFVLGYMGPYWTAQQQPRTAPDLNVTHNPMTPE